jgi:hypothetical protein
MGFRHSNGCKIGSADDNVDEPDQSVLVRRGGNEWVGRWCAVERLPLLADWSAPGMLNKHNDDRRHPISKMTFKVTNWAIYEGGSVSFRGELRSRQTSGYQKLYQAAEIRSRSAATRSTWMVRRWASETFWLMVLVGRRKLRTSSKARQKR